MAQPIENYAIIGDGETAALVGKNGAIDWLCWPRFHSEACLAALLGDEDNGAWRIGADGPCDVSRRYDGDTAILETTFMTDGGRATLIDFMPLRKDGERSSIIRLVRGDDGVVPLTMSIKPRFDYGRLTPWISTPAEQAVEFICGPHTLTLFTPVDTENDNGGCRARFKAHAGETLVFALNYRPSYHPRQARPDVERALQETRGFWQNWTARCTYLGPHRDAVLRSLITMKLHASAETGGIIAAATMGLPEKIGGKRNWDYRFCWLRDATFTLLALLHSGYCDEARAWRDWLLRAIAGMPSAVQPVYGVAGQHRLPEWPINWLAGYRGSTPVRAGNLAYSQFQLDTYGEVMDALHQARGRGLEDEGWAWELQRELVEQVERIWPEPDAGIWEARHGRERFTHSRVLAWVAVDRAVRAAEAYDLDWPLERWRSLRSRIHAEICDQGYDAQAGAFMRSYETREPDGANLLLPLVGFLPPHDRRVRGTLAQIERELIGDGLVYRYDTRKSKDGMPEGEGAFLACNFWYVDNLAMQGRLDEARAHFEKLLELRNDVGLLSEEYDPVEGMMLGNFPQVLSHLSLVNCAHNLEQRESPSTARSGHSVRRKVRAAQAS